MIDSQWKDKKVAFLGDSITDKIHVGTKKNYWQFLGEKLGIVPLVYGIDGNSWIHARQQAERLFSEHAADVDAIFIFLGTNDYNCSVPLGDWYHFKVESVNANGVNVSRLRRIFNTDADTLRGRINAAMAYLKQTFPRQQIMLATPLHRESSRFSETNVQPGESFPNALGLYLDSYVSAVREAADIWSCPLVDLYRDSGLHPLTESHGQFFHDPETDRLHPGAAGHERLADTIMYRLLALPATFREIPEP